MPTTNKVKSFSAIHYDREKVKGLKKLVCPPYDVISPKHHKRLKRTSAYNFSHVLLKNTKTSYKKLGYIFRDWLRRGVLREDKDAALYVTLQEFKIGSKKFRRRGFLGLLKLDEKNLVFPHEETHARPKKDRLSIIRQFKANLSPIFVIYPKKQGEPTASILKKVSRSKPFLKVTDDKNVTYKVWRVTNTLQVNKILNYFKNAPLLIADGHHRFEVACQFFKENKKKKKKFRELNYILAYFSPQDKNLCILPTHRVLMRKLDVPRLTDKLKPYFFIKRYKSLKSLEKSLKRSKFFCFGFYQNQHIFSFHLKNAHFLDKIYATHSLYKRLDTFLLHKWVLAYLLNIRPRESELSYIKSLRQAKLEADRFKGCCFILRPPRIEDVMSIALAGYKLPQKSTYFYPKFLSGLILRKLY